MGQLHRQILRPMGIDAVPGSIKQAIDMFVSRRDILEGELGVVVDRDLEREVRAGIDRALTA
jgi:hypothetical protein